MAECHLFLAFRWWWTPYIWLCTQLLKIIRPFLSEEQLDEAIDRLAGFAAKRGTYVFTKPA